MLLRRFACMHTCESPYRYLELELELELGRVMHGERVVDS